MCASLPHALHVGTESPAGELGPGPRPWSDRTLPASCRPFRAVALPCAWSECGRGVRSPEGTSAPACLSGSQAVSSLPRPPAESGSFQRQEQGPVPGLGRSMDRALCGVASILTALLQVTDGRVAGQSVRTSVSLALLLVGSSPVLVHTLPPSDGRSPVTSASSQPPRDTHSGVFCSFIYSFLNKHRSPLLSESRAFQ